MLKLSVNGYESIRPFHLNFLDRNKKLEHFSYAPHGQRTTHSRSTRRRCKAVGTEIAICVSFFFLFFSRFDFPLDIYVYVYIYIFIYTGCITICGTHCRSEQGAQKQRKKFTYEHESDLAFFRTYSY